MRLLVNIDHVATLRNARGEGVPDPVKAAYIAEQAGAAGIVFHLREDRRHIKDEDVIRLKSGISGLIDFEMAATPEMLDICRRIRPDVCTLVPENRMELTTEGGLNMPVVFDRFKDEVIPALQERNIEISLFIDPIPEHIELAAKAGAEAIELHTGEYAHRWIDGDYRKEMVRLSHAANLASTLGLKVNAGHGLNFDNIEALIRNVPHLADISIGHALITDALFRGLENSVRAMVALLRKYSFGA